MLRLPRCIEAYGLITYGNTGEKQLAHITKWNSLFLWDSSTDEWSEPTNGIWAFEELCSERTTFFELTSEQADDFMAKHMPNRMIIERNRAAFAARFKQALEDIG